ncbi:quercetin dioxygenase-like cupin family protein [Cryobacterium sp. MP_M3]|uniref:cupin domain-containing protein n=1 Tax=unclassified Cryobacterium TaxID=2649013 RepID=UPI0018CB85F7|nr:MULTISPECIES: cupin domain-containing protein [unclassified Cryobacterium]MBG6059316.1 quercetin dioxygenase-like cupin family protein [Cryobacterium sp. MP_M3]
MTTLTATVRDTDAGERRWFCGGGLHTWVATGAETGGAFLIFEDALDAGKVTPLHRHPDADETFYMLEGEILLDLDGEQQSLHAGGIAIIPRGIPHAFMVTSPRARMLCLQNPATGEAFYRMASEPDGGEDAEPPLDFERVRAAASATGAIEILGPPPFPPVASPAI